MSKISQAVASDVAKKFVAQKFDRLDEEHRRHTAEYVREALEAHYGADHLRAFRKLPPVFHCRQTTHQFLIGDRGYYVTLNTPESVVVPYVFGSGSSIKVSGELGAEMQAWSVEQERLKSERKRLQDTTYKTLLSFGSLARIRAEWPDVAKFLPTIVKAQLPAVLPETINAELQAADTPPAKTKTARGRARAA